MITTTNNHAAARIFYSANATAEAIIELQRQGLSARSVKLEFGRGWVIQLDTAIPRWIKSI